MSTTTTPAATAAPSAPPPAPLLSTQPEWEHAALPGWFADRQRSAWAECLEAPLPKRGDEAWRFSDHAKYDFSLVKPSDSFGSAESKAAVARSAGLAEVSAKLILGNDELLHARSEGADGIVVMPLREALRLHGDLIQQYFLSRPATLGGAKYYALHAASLNGGVFIYIPDGVEVQKPIELHQWLGGINGAVFPHTLVVAGKRSKVTVIDYFQSLTSEPGFACGITDLIALDGAAVTYVACQRWSRKVQSLHYASITAERDATVKSSVISLGASLSRVESLCEAKGSGSRSEMLSLAIAESTQEFDFRTRQIHRQPHTYSNLLFKNVLFDKARAIFAGLIYVEKGAHFTDAYQTCRNLLLSDECEANSLPGLEINADQVKCSHGSTSGPIRGEEIYYLRSRGIHEKTARQLLAAGFCGEVMSRLEDVALEAAMASMVEEKFRRMT